eukprot:CFRG3774T1
MSHPKFKYVSNEDIRRVLSIDACLEAVYEAFDALDTDRAENPHHLNLASPGGVVLFKPATVHGAGLGAKIISVFNGNSKRFPALPNLNGTIIMMNEETGQLKAVLDADLITTMRTAGGSAVSVNELAPKDVKVLLVFGAGPQAEWHIRMILHVRPTIHKVYIINRTFKSAQTLVDSLSNEFESVVMEATDDTKGATTQADIIATCTGAQTPLFKADWVKPVCHIAAVGSYTPQMHEIPVDLFKNAEVVVDCILANKEAGELLDAFEAEVLNPANITTMGMWIRQGRQAHHGKRTIYKSVGFGLMDITTSHKVLLALE